MTVAQLIAKLQCCPQDAEVYFTSDANDIHPMEIRDVEILTISVRGGDNFDVHLTSDRR